METIIVMVVIFVITNLIGSAGKKNQKSQLPKPDQSPVNQEYSAYGDQDEDYEYDLEDAAKPYASEHTSTWKQLAKQSGFDIDELKGAFGKMNGEIQQKRQNYELSKEQMGKAILMGGGLYREAETQPELCEANPEMTPNADMQGQSVIEAGLAGVQPSKSIIEQDLTHAVPTQSLIEKEMLGGEIGGTQGSSMVRPTLQGIHAQAKDVDPVGSSLSRMGHLTPLQQGYIWKEILDGPVCIKRR